MGRHDTHGQLGRRDIIKKAAVAGGLAWTAPMILSSQVSATVGTCPDGCPTCYAAKFDWDEDNDVWKTCSGVGGSPCGSSITACTTYVNGCISGVSISGPQNSPTVTVPSDAKIIQTVSKEGPNCGSTTIDPSTCATSVDVSQQSSNDISHVIVVFCK